MITNLNIQNFQSILDLDLELDRYTVFVGRSNSGKSALLRALHVLARNSFSPSQVRFGKTNTTITATVEDTEVSTIRGTQSTYSYTHLNAEPEVFTKCGRSVPDAVSDLLNVPIVAEEDVFFTNQFEPPFLVSGKASRASSLIGTLTNAVLVNSLAQETNRLRLNTLSKISVRKEDVQSLEVERESYEDVDAQEQALYALRTLVDELEVLEVGVEGLRASMTRLRAIERVSVPSVPNVEQKMGALEQVDVDITRLRALLEQVDRVERVAVPSVPEVTEWGKLEDVSNDSGCIAHLIEEIKLAKKEYARTSSVLVNISDEMEELTDKLSGFVTCELCGQLLP